jgi:hypothetical protein
LSPVVENVKLVQPIQKEVWKFLKKLKTDLPYNLVMPFLGMYPKDTIQPLPHPCLLHHCSQ